MSRLSVNINDETYYAILAMQGKRQTNATEVIRRAVSVYAFLARAQADGNAIETVDNEGRTTRVVIP